MESLETTELRETLAVTGTQDHEVLLVAEETLVHLEPLEAREKSDDRSLAVTAPLDLRA